MDPDDPRRFTMYGDTSVIRHLAHELGEQAQEIRACSQQLLLDSTSTPWHGVAADAMRASAARQAAAMRHTATLHDDAAAALRRHAQRVDETKAQIASIEHLVHGLVSGARDRISSLVDVAADPVDALLDHFDPPAPGSIAWLDVQLPGLPGVHMWTGAAA